MNKIYKVIWSKAKHCYVVASELAKRNGKSAQKAVVGAVIAGVLGVGVLGVSSSAMAASRGYSYDAAAMLTAVTHDDSTGLGFSMVRGDRSDSDALHYHLAVTTITDDSGNIVGYQGGYYGSSNGWHALTDTGTIEAAYDAIKNRPGQTIPSSTHKYEKEIYFDANSIDAYLRNVKGYSDATIGDMTLDTNYRFTLVEAEASAEFNKELIKETETMVYNTVGQVLQPGENVAVEKAGYLTQKDAAGNIQGYVDKDGNVIKDATGKVITTPIAELTDDQKAYLESKGVLPSEYDVHAADSQTTASVSGTDLVLTQKLADIDEKGNAKLDANGKIIYTTTTATIKTGDNITATGESDEAGNVTYTLSAENTKYTGAQTVTGATGVKDVKNGSAMITVSEVGTGEGGADKELASLTVKAGENVAITKDSEGVAVINAVDTDTQYRTVQTTTPGGVNEGKTEVKLYPVNSDGKLGEAAGTTTLYAGKNAKIALSADGSGAVFSALNNTVTNKDNYITVDNTDTTTNGDGSINYKVGLNTEALKKAIDTNTTYTFTPENVTEDETKAGVVSKITVTETTPDGKTTEVAKFTDTDTNTVLDEASEGLKMDSTGLTMSVKDTDGNEVTKTVALDTLKEVIDTNTQYKTVQTTTTGGEGTGSTVVTMSTVPADGSEGTVVGKATIKAGKNVKITNEAVDEENFVAVFSSLNNTVESNDNYIVVDDTAKNEDGSINYKIGLNPKGLPGLQDAIGPHYYSVNDNNNHQGNYDNKGATGLYAIAAGTNASATADYAVAIGDRATSSEVGGIALGSYSKADTKAGIPGYDPVTKTDSTETDDKVWTSTAAAVSVGGTVTVTDEEGNSTTYETTRQITNVAAGKELSDVVNVAQLIQAQTAATTEVKQGDNITVTPSKDDKDGHPVYTISGLKTEVTSSDKSVRITEGEANEKGVITFDLSVEKVVDTNTIYDLDVTQTEDKGEGTTATVTFTDSAGGSKTFDIVDTNTHTSVKGDEKYIKVEQTGKVSAEAGPEYTVSLNIDELKGAIDTDTRNTVVAGDRITVDEVKNKDGSSQYTVNGANVVKGDNIEVTYDEKANEFTIGTAADVKFENVEVTNEFKAGDTIINEGGITTNEFKAGDTVINEGGVTTNNVTTNEFKAGDTIINEGGVTTNNVTTNEFKAGDTIINEGGVTTNNIETKNINVTENITYKGDKMVTDVTYEGDNNTLYVTKGDEVTEYTLKGNVYEGDNKTINISKDNVISVIEGNVAEGDKGVVTGDTVYNETRVKKDGNYIKKDSTAAENITALDNQVSNNSQNIENLGNAINNTNNQISSLDNRMKKGIAGAAALAALHPMDFNPDDKLQFAAGVGNYRGETAAAVGAFYRPDESVMFSVGGTFGNADNMVNAGITFGLDGNKNRITRSRTAMAREIQDLRSLVTQMAARMDRLENANGIETAMFPDVPENHWAYEYVEDLQKRGVLKGYPDGLFKGDRNMTRYEFAAMLDRIVRSGVTLDSQIAKEFEPELGRIYVERISGRDNDRKKIERVRVNNSDSKYPEGKTRDVYGSKIQPVVSEKAAGE